jgi:hypothetical protein
VNLRAAVATALIAAPLIWLSEHARTEHPLPIRLIPVEDAAAFARCKAAGNHIELTDDGHAYDSTSTTRPLWCEEKN